MIKQNLLTNLPLITSMSEKRQSGFMICKGQETHILLYEVPDGDSLASFVEKTLCKICGAKLGLVIG